MATTPPISKTNLVQELSEWLDQAKLIIKLHFDDLIYRADVVTDRIKNYPQFFGPYDSVVTYLKNHNKSLSNKPKTLHNKQQIYIIHQYKVAVPVKLLYLPNSPMETDTTKFMHILRILKIIIETNKDQVRRNKDLKSLKLFGFLLYILYGFDVTLYYSIDYKGKIDDEVYDLVNYAINSGLTTGIPINWVRLHEEFSRILETLKIDCRPSHVSIPVLDKLFYNVLTSLCEHNQIDIQGTFYLRNSQKNHEECCFMIPRNINYYGNSCTESELVIFRPHLSIIEIEPIVMMDYLNPEQRIFLNQNLNTYTNYWTNAVKTWEKIKKQHIV